MIEAYGTSDIGKKRHRNEDSFIVNSDINLFLVADGMGGHNAGDVASATAAKTVENFMSYSNQERELTWPFGIDPKMSFDANRLRTALHFHFTMAERPPIAFAEPCKSCEIITPPANSL